MDKIALQCDVCGGPLTMQSGGQTAVCDYCGTRYALERLREKVQEIRGKVTVEGVVKTSSADFEIHAGVLVKYHGEDTEIVIPEGVVKEIGTDCFKGCQYITSVKLPDGLQKISNGAFYGCSSLEKVNIPDSVIEIGQSGFNSGRAGAFSDCISLRTISIPNAVALIGVNAFSDCSSLEMVNIPDSVTEIAGGAFACCNKLKVVNISNVALKRLCPQIHENRHEAWNGVPAFTSYSWSWNAFWGWGGSVSCSSPATGHRQIKSYIYLDSDFARNHKAQLENASPWFRKVLSEKQSQIDELLRPENWKLSNLCQHCGGKFKGVFTKTCEDCGRVKDY